MKSFLADFWRNEDADRLVAFGSGGDRRLAEMRRDVARVMQELRQHDGAAPLLFVFREDRYLFSVSMLAAWSLGRSIALPPNTRRDTVGELLQSGALGVMLHDLESEAGIPIRPLCQGDSSAPIEAFPAHFETWDDADALAAILYTSGSTRLQSSTSEKSASQLFAEVMALRDEIVPQVSRVVATVGPSHIYGLLYSVLVPLMSKGSFLRETPFFPQAVVEACARHQADCLVTVPAHLRSFLSVDADAFDEVTRIVSSTAPLSPETSRAFYQRFGRDIVEVLGSTETGGLAWRIAVQETLWTPLSSVDLRSDEEGRLLVDSPFLPAKEPQPFETADLVRFEGGRFEHLGRVDGVVKIGGRRVSIPEMEETVLQRPGIEDAALLALETENARGVSLYLVVQTHTQTREEILAFLADRYEHSTLPRRVEIVEKLPREANGKLTRARLLDVFGLNEMGQPNVWSLHWDRWKHAFEGERELHRVHIDVPSTYGWFKGHFTGYPVMAAAVQLHEIVVPGLRSIYGDGVVRQVSRMKFTGRIQPGDRVELEIQGPSEAAEFQLRKDGKLCASGVAMWEETP